MTMRVRADQGPTASWSVCGSRRPGIDADHDIEESDALPPCSRGIGEWIDDLQLSTTEPPGPAVRAGDRNAILMFRTNVNEMNVQPIAFRCELRAMRLNFASILRQSYLSPNSEASEGSVDKMHALGCIRDRFPFRPLVLLMRLRQFGEFASVTVTSETENRLLSFASVLPFRFATAIVCGHGIPPLR